MNHNEQKFVPSMRPRIHRVVAKPTLESITGDSFVGHRFTFDEFLGHIIAEDEYIIHLMAHYPNITVGPETTMAPLQVAVIKVRTKSL